MPIDPNGITWDDDKPDPSGITWDEPKAPAQSAHYRTPMKADPAYDPLEGTNWLQRGFIGAGKAANDLLRGIGLSPDGTIGRALGVVEPVPSADKALMSDPAGIVGNIAGQAGMMYAGGTLLKGAGSALSGARSLGSMAQPVGSALESVGSAVVSPSSYKQAGLVGAGWGALSQPGDVVDRAMNATVGGLGGLGGMAIGRGLENAGQAVKVAMTPNSQVQADITARLSGSGIDFNALPRAVQQQIMKIGKRSIEDVGSLDKEQLARMADFNALGINPTQGWVTRDPKQWWLENNLNTVDDQIAARFKDANQALLQGVTKDVGTASDYQLGRRLEGTITDYDSGLKGNVDALYAKARDAAGRDIPLDPHQFVNNASVELDQQMLGSKLPADTLSWFQKATSGQEPFDMGTALQRLQAINGRIYSTNDPAEAKALGIVKKHLINSIDNGEAAGFNPNPGQQWAPGGSTFEPSVDPSFGGNQIGGPGRFLPGGNGGNNGSLMPFQGSVGPFTGEQPSAPGIADAFRAARAAAADRFRFQEASPLVDRILKGQYTPERLPDMIGSMKVDDIYGLQKLQAERGVPIMSSLSDATKAYIRDASTLQGETGGTFSARGLRTALDRIGPEKGRAILGDATWDHYQQVLRSAGNINNAPLKPAGSATASNMLRMLQQVPIPGVPKAINLAITGVGKLKQLSDVGSALNAGGSLLMPTIATQKANYLPLLTTPGLLGVSE